MEKFTDINGKEWSLKITVGTIKAVRDELKIDLTSMDTLKILGEDICLLVDCLFVCCRDEAERVGITDIMFGESMAGNAIDSATDAFMDELINFFPAQKGNLLRKTIAKTRLILAEETAKAEKRIENLSLEQLIDSQES